MIKITHTNTIKVDFNLKDNINFHDYVRFMQSHNKDCQRGISMMSNDKFRDKYYSTFSEDINFSSISVPMNLTKNKRCIFSADIHVVKNKQQRMNMAWCSRSSKLFT